MVRPRQNHAGTYTFFVARGATRVHIKYFDRIIKVYCTYNCFAAILNVSFCLSYICKLKNSLDFSGLWFVGLDNSYYLVFPGGSTGKAK